MAKSSLNSALVIIVVSCTICVLLTAIAAVVTGDWLFATASVLFTIAGVSSIYVVRALKQKINGK